MDLLLHLITKHKLNIYDIPIFELVEQYNSYIRKMQEQNLDIASEFLEMSARLVHIKSVSLLPVYGEAMQLKEELSGELIEYQLCKQVAARLAENSDGFNCFTRNPEKIEVDMTYKRLHDASELINAYMSAVGKRMRKLPPPLDVFRNIVTRKIVSVSHKIRDVVKTLSLKGRHTFSSLFFTSESRSDMVATFLALLELTKRKNITLTEKNGDTLITLISVPEGEISVE